MCRFENNRTDWWSQVPATLPVPSPGTRQGDGGRVELGHWVVVVVSLAHSEALDDGFPNRQRGFLWAASHHDGPIYLFTDGLRK